mmetsp:Transcript_18037/g.31058  ORF Transcript_18037/g.31058 Transcript_18037/m.31058 type:complete len:114 (-) Transcript_18037:409-750(-)
MTKDLIKQDPAAVRDALSEAGMRVVEKMDSVTEAAMWKDGGVKSRTARRVIRRHIRHHFGKDALSSERELMELSKGHSPVETKYYCSYIHSNMPSSCYSTNSSTLYFLMRFAE